MRQTLWLTLAPILWLAALTLGARAEESFATFKSLDRGQSWQRFDTGLPAASRINAFGSAGEVLFAGTDAGLFTSRVEAPHWQPAGGVATTSGRILALAASGPRVWAGTDRSGLLVSTDGGTSWAVERGFPARKVRCLLAQGETVYAGTEADGVFVSPGPDQPWTPLTAGLPAHAQIFALAAVRGEVFAGLYSLGLYRLDPQHHTWTKRGDVTPLALASVGETLIVGHNPGGLHWTADRGATWATGRAAGEVPGGLSSVLPPISGELSPHAPVWELGSDAQLAIAGASDGIYHTADRGKTWQRARHGLPEKSAGIAFLVQPDLILAGTILRGHRVAIEASTRDPLPFPSSDSGKP